MFTAEAAALAATALALVGALPQLRRLALSGDTNGVSLTTATLGVGSELGWVAYTLQGSLWSAIPEAALMAVTNLLLARALMRAGVSFARPVAVAAIWGATLVVATMLAGWVFLGALLPIAYGVQVAPSIWSAYRTWAPSGVALATWVTILVECVLWGVYGLARQDPALTTLGVIGSAAALAIVVRVLWTRDRFSHDGARLCRRIEREGLVPLAAGGVVVSRAFRDHRQEASPRRTRQPQRTAPISHRRSRPSFDTISP